MIALDLVTGFLGAGKTTFLKKYVPWLKEAGHNVCILENDYGAVNTDVLLLQDLRDDRCEIEMIVGGDGYEAHRRRLRTKLISMAMTGYDRVVMEPSGIFDADELTDLLSEEPLDGWYRLENVIAVVDAASEMDMTEETAWLMAAQTADAGRVVLSKVQRATPQKCAGVVDKLNALMQACGCSRRFGEQDVLIRNWDDLTQGDKESIMRAGHKKYDFVHRQVAKENDYESLFYFRLRMTAQEAGLAARACLEDGLCGNVIRVKGCFAEEDAEGKAAGENPGPKWYLLNATKENCRITPCPSGQEVVIVIGENLCKERIDAYWVWEGLSF